jgi:hypothetical protein
MFIRDHSRDQTLTSASVRGHRVLKSHNAAAVAAGLQRTGGLITSLALPLVIVVGLFSASGITFLKLRIKTRITQNEGVFLPPGRP